MAVSYTHLDVYKRQLLICGGAQTYEQSLPYADELWLSLLPDTYEGTVFFPKFDEKDFMVKEQIRYTKFQFFRLLRKKKGASL